MVTFHKVEKKQRAATSTIKFVLHTQRFLSFSLIALSFVFLSDRFGSQWDLRCALQVSSAVAAAVAAARDTETEDDATAITQEDAGPNGTDDASYTDDNGQGA